MRLVNAYVFRQIATVTAMVAVTLTCAIWLTQSLRFIELIVNRGLSLGTFFALTLLLLPSFLWLLLPIALFAAVLFTYQRLISDSELIVIRAAGLSPLQIARPALAVAGLATMAGYVLSLYFLPLAYRDFKDLDSAIRNDFAGIMLREGTFNVVSQNVTVYVRARDPSGDLIGLLLHDARRPEQVVSMIAESGRLAIAEGGPRVILVNGNRQEYDSRSGRLRMLYFDRYSVDLGRAAEQAGERWREPRERFLHELLGPPRDAMDRQHLDRLRAEGHSRLASPLLALALTLVALAALVPGEHDRRGIARRVVAAVAVAAAIQTASIAAQNAVAKWPVLTPLIYLSTVVPIAVGYWWLAAGPPGRLFRRMSRPDAPPGLGPGAPA
jgi:lipopolysaccharide export system permease protein